ncbi:MAG: hypothetical protein Q7S92_05985 [Candidatus Diapherotrites archaeon]|nr:hypothetical protein [Candidatus Diapherotrites archaeon]
MTNIESQVHFGLTKIGEPQIKEFFYQKLHEFFLDLQIPELEIRMSCEEGLKAILETSILNEAMLKRVLNDFCKNYSIPDMTCLRSSSSQTSVAGKIKTRNLFHALSSNEVLVEIFWPNIICTAGNLSLNFSIGSRNILIVQGSVEMIEQAKIILKKMYSNIRME